MEKKVTVITACYNVSEYLPRCIESLLNQTIGLEALELIFVDDASTDDTLSYLLELEKKYPENVIVIVNEENKRMGIARNIGMQYATGKYIGFVDADDWILPEMYETLYKRAEEYQCDIVGSRLIRVSNRETSARGRLEPEEKDYFIHIETKEQRKKLLAGGMAVFDTVNVVTKLYRRDFIQENQLHFGEHFAFEDLYFSDLAAFYVKRFAMVLGEYYHYFVHDNSIMTSMNGEKWVNQRKVMLHWLEVCRERGLLDTFYRETELIFARDYYISNLHFLLTRGTLGQKEADYIEECRKTMWQLFPEVTDNPYIGKGEYFHEFQKPLLEHLKKPFRRGELQKIQKNYCDALLGMARKEKFPKSSQVQEKEENLKTLEIMIAADKNYLYPAMVLLVSLFHNHRSEKMKVYFLQSGISRQEQQELQQLAGRWKDKEIHCIEIKEEQLLGLKGFGRFSVAAFYRILGMGRIPDDIERVLYLDVDMVVNKNLSELFSMEMKQPLAACYDINNELQGNIGYHKSVLGISPEQGYFNSGMLLLDMKYIRKNQVEDILLRDIAENFETYSLIDQDALNKYYSGKTTYLPWQKYNCPCVPFLIEEREGNICQENFLSYEDIRKIQDENVCCYDVTNQMMKEASIIHFCTSQKPWHDRDFYETENRKEARTIYERYERLLKRMISSGM